MARTSLKVGGSLRDYLDATKRQPRLLGAVERHLLTRPPEDRRQDVLHPSEIVKEDFCRRAAYYQLTATAKKDSRPSLRLQNIFDEGHAIHHKWQSRFREMGNLYGRWTCDNCETTWWGLPPVLGCVECTAPESCVRYSEVTLMSEPRYRIAGHADGWISDIGDDCLIEVKSIGSGTIRIEAPEIWEKAEENLEDAWRNIKRPFASHVRQGALYLELGSQMVKRGYFDTFPDEIVFIYELKSNQDIKEFVVKRSQEITDRLLDTAARVVEAVDNRTLPACNLDRTKGCTRCRAYEHAKDLTL